MTISSLDHIIYATPDLDRAIEEIEALTGVAPVRGGSHPGRGTRNALLSLGPDTYIEILAPDPAQSADALALAHDRIPATGRIINWAAKCNDLEAALETAGAGGLDLGSIEPMSRSLPSGSRLDWRLTRGDLLGGGLVPFLIDWGQSPHPALTAPAGCTLRYFRAEHFDPVRVREQLSLIGLQDVLEISQGSSPRILAGLSTPRGNVVLQ
jgi:hypothetical protein